MEKKEIAMKPILLNREVSTSSAIGVFKPASVHLACIAFKTSLDGLVEVLAAREITRCGKGTRVRTKLVGAECSPKGFPRKEICVAFKDKVLKPNRRSQGLVFPNYFVDIGHIMCFSNVTKRLEHMSMFFSLDVRNIHPSDLRHWYTEVPLKGNEKKIVHPPRFVSLSEMIGFLREFEAARPTLHALLLVLWSEAQKNKHVKLRYSSILAEYRDVFEQYFPSATQETQEQGLIAA